MSESTFQTQPKVANSTFPRQCVPCRCVLNSASQWSAHVAGKKHKKCVQAAKLGEAFVVASTTTTTTTTDTENANGNTIDNSSDNNNGNNLTDEFVIEIDGVRKCSICDVDFTSIQSEIQHIRGKRHAMMKEGHRNGMRPRKRKLGGVSMGACDLCDVTFTSVSHRASHMAGKKHLKNIALSEAGKPPKKKTKMGYFGNTASYDPNSALQCTANDTAAPASILENGERELFAHEILQKETETAYKIYTEVAKKRPSKAPELYKRYQSSYDRYLKAYTEFAAQFANANAVQSDTDEKTTVNTIAAEDNTDDSAHTQTQILPQSETQPSAAIDTQSNGQ